MRRITRDKRGIELSINFLVTLIIAIVLFGMGIFLANMIFSGGGEIAERQFADFDRQVGELACYSSDNVCINIKEKEVLRGKFDTLAVTIRNAFDKTDFKTTITNTKFIPADKTLPVQEGNAITTKLLLFGFDTGRIETLEKREKKTFGVGIEIPKEAPSGQYVLTVNVTYKDTADNTFKPYTDNPYKMFITVP